MNAIDLERELFLPLLDGVIGSSGVGLSVLDDELRYVFVNSVAAEVYDAPPGSVVGHGVDEVIPEIVDVVTPILRRVLDSGEPVQRVEVDGRLPGTHGQVGHWMASYFPVDAGGRRHVAVVFVEITEQRRLQKRLRDLIDGLFTVVGLLAPDGTLLEANETALSAGGLARDEVIGRPLWETYWFAHSAQVRDELRAAVARAAAGEMSRYDVEVRVAGGRLITIDFQLVPIVDDGRVTAIVPSGLDITDRVADRARLEALAHLSGALNGALRTEEVARLTAEHGPAVVEADFVNVGLLDRASRSVHMVLPPVIEVLAEWGPIHLDGPRTPFHHVIETGTPCFVDRTNRAELFPHLVEDAERAGLEAVVVMPLFDSDGSVVGGLAHGWRTLVEHSDESRARLTVLADLCSQALQRVRTGETRDDLVHELQGEILAPWEMPQTLEVGVAYQPANDELGFGGDWYDVITLDGRAVFVVGDVAGHGTPAAARMTATKATIRAFVTAFSPEEVIPRVNDALTHLQSGYVATAALAWIDKRAHTLQWCLAGHPPPVLRSPDGTTRLLEGVHHPPIGMRGAPRPLPFVPFPPGSQLVLYTDGLIERRDVDLDTRLEALRTTVADLPSSLSVDEVCDRLIGSLSDGHDDTAVIVIRQPVPSR